MGRGRKVILAAGVLAMLAGAALLAWPSAHQALYEGEVASMKQAFTDAASGPAPGGPPAGSDAGAAAAEVDVEGLYAYLKAENERLYEEGQSELVDAFSYQQPAVDLARFGIEDNCIGFLSVPSMDVVLPVYLGANDEQMAHGAVHLTQTSYPIGTENSNSVIAAHRGTFDGLSMFRNIDRMSVGDPVFLTNFKETLVYRACEVKIISPTDTDEVRIQEGRDLVTLVTCNPLWGSYERYVVYCERTE